MYIYIYIVNILYIMYMMSSIYHAFYQYHISKRLKDMTNNYMCKLCVYIYIKKLI